MSKDKRPSDLHLRLFVEIAKDESLTKAAERLNISQPALSQHLHQLEEALGQRLMTRHGRGLRLTEAGIALEHQLHGVFHHIDVSVARFRDSMGKTSGTITVASVHNINLYFLPPIIKTFCDEHPHANVRVLGRTSGEVEKLVIESHVDVGLLYGTHVTDDRLASIHLFNETMIAACLPDLAVAEQIRDGGLLPRGTPVVVFPRACAVRSMLQREFPPGHLIVKAETEALDAMLALAGAGVGVCILPAGVPDRVLSAFGLQRFVLRDSRLMRCATLTFRKEVEQSPMVQALLQQIRSAAKSRHESALSVATATAGKSDKVSAISRVAHPVTTAFFK